MMEVKAGRPLIDLVKLCYAAGRSPLLVGRHGVGKSMVLKQAARELGIDYICRDLSLMEPPDLVGIPRIDGRVTRYFPPSFLPSDGEGLLVFEELNRCERYMRSPCLQLLTERTLNDYELPPGWLPCAALNPPEEGYQADELDPALLSRFVRSEVVPDREEWLAWARKSGLHPGVIAHVASDPSIFKSAESNPRSWAYISQDAYAASKIGASRETFQRAVVGEVGYERGMAFLRDFKYEVRPLTVDEIREYLRHRERLMGWVNADHRELLEGSLHALLTHLQAERNYNLIREDSDLWKNVSAFLADLPDDLKNEAKEFFRENHYKARRARRRA